MGKGVIRQKQEENVGRWGQIGTFVGCTQGTLTLFYFLVSINCFNLTNNNL